ncbi:MAG: hypothetical protein LBJ18_01005 [Rickettsiales bacterium]|jgi:hypothetical protein|nr:hypothetical protein [Rickettsiales bacterium]
MFHKKRLFALGLAALGFGAPRAAGQDVRIDTIPISNESELAQNQGGYNHSKKSIFIKFFTPAPDARPGLSGAIDKLNQRIPGIKIHESKHFADYQISLQGLTSAQISDFVFYDEIAARASELLWRRKIYLETGSLQQAFAGEIIGSEKKRISESEHSVALIYSSRFYGAYADWLDNNEIGAEISRAELQLILDESARDLSDGESQINIYSQTLPNNTKQKLTDTAAEMQAALRGRNAAAPIGWNRVMEQVFQFDNINALDIMGAEYFENLRSYFEPTRRNEIFMKKMSELESGCSQFDSLRDMYLAKYISEMMISLKILRLM